MNVKLVVCLALMACCAWAVRVGSAQADNAAPATGAAKIDIPKEFTDNCARCHNINGLRAVCPDLSTIGLRADAAYIRQSILDPNAVIVPGFPADVMPQNFAKILTSGQVDTLVQFLLTLKGQTADPGRVGKAVKW